MDKSVMGARTKGLLQRVCNDFGNMASSKFIDDLQNVVTEYMKSSAFSVGVSDLISNQKTNDEIVQNYNASKGRYITPENIVTNGLVLNIDPANSSSYSGVGNTIYDLSGFGNTGTLTNGPTFSALNGGNLIFDGSNDFLGAASSSSLDISTNLSAVVWMKLITTDGANQEDDARKNEPGSDL